MKGKLIMSKFDEVVIDIFNKISTIKYDDKDKLQILLNIIVNLSHMLDSEDEYNKVIEVLKEYDERERGRSR